MKMHDRDRALLEQLCAGQIPPSVLELYEKYQTAWMRVMSGPMEPLILMTIAVEGCGVKPADDAPQSEWHGVPEESAVVVMHSALPDKVYCEGLFMGVAMGGPHKGHLIIAVHGDRGHQVPYPERRVKLKSSLEKTVYAVVNEEDAELLKNAPDGDVLPVVDGKVVEHVPAEEEPEDDLVPSYLSDEPPPWYEVELGSPVWAEETGEDGISRTLAGKFRGVADSGALKVGIKGVHRGLGFREFPPDSVRLDRQAIKEAEEVAAASAT